MRNDLLRVPGGVFNVFINYPSPTKGPTEIYSSEWVKDVVGNFAKRNVQQKESGKQKENPHIPSVRITLNPHPHCSEPNRKEYCHQTYREIIIGTAYNSDLRNG